MGRYFFSLKCRLRMKEVYEGKVSNGQKKDCEVREVQTDRTTMTVIQPLVPGWRISKCNIRTLLLWAMYIYIYMYINKLLGERTQ